MKTLAERVIEVTDWCHAKGWYDTPEDFHAYMTLLHSELSEACDAWRERAFDSWEVIKVAPEAASGSVPKPEGVASELADAFIRLCDDAGRFHIDLYPTLPAELRMVSPDLAAMGKEAAGNWSSVGRSFLGDLDWLHVDIAKMSCATRAELPAAIGKFLTRLLAICHIYGIDLNYEYERKMKYNWTRTYRHGQKAL